MEEGQVGEAMANSKAVCSISGEVRYNSGTIAKYLLHG